MSNHNMDLTNNEIFKLGMEAGRKQLMDHIQHQCSIGKPVEINGELYWLTDSRQYLINVMDSIESAWNEESGGHKFIVPLKHPREEITREVIIQADTAERAYMIALLDFDQGSGWSVDTDYQHYKQLKG